METFYKRGIARRSLRPVQHARRLTLFIGVPAIVILGTIAAFAYRQIEQHFERGHAITKLKQISEFYYDNACPRWLDHAWVRNILGNDFYNRFEYIKYATLMPDEETFNEKIQGMNYEGPAPFTYGRGTTDDDLALLTHLKKLKSLDLTYTNITDAGLSHLTKLDGLSTLLLNSTDISDVGMVHIGQLGQLERLSIGSTHVGDAGIAHLSKMENLTYLDLSETFITNVGLMHLKNLLNLTRLDLRGTSVDDAGLMHLTNLTKLEELIVSDTFVSYLGKADLKSVLPNVEFPDW